MTDLAEGIRTHIDDTAAPIVIDEIRATPRRHDHRNRSGVVMAAACAVLIATLAVVVWSRQSDAPPPVADEQGAPSWYTAIAGALPEGFEHVAVITSQPEFVIFEVIDLTTSQRLFLSVARIAVDPDPGGTMTLAEVAAQRWNDVTVERNVTLPDGREIGISCYLADVATGRPGCALEATRLAPDDLRTLVLAAADSLVPAVLPPPGHLANIAADTIRRFVTPLVDLPENGAVDRPGDGFSFVAYGLDDGSLPAVNVRTVTGIFPPLDPSEVRRSIDVDDRRSTWQVMPDGTLWSVVDTPLRGADVADAILDAVASSTPPSDPGQLAYSPTSDGPLPVWPEVRVSDTPSLTSSYGFDRCDSSPFTKYAALESAAGIEHAYYGTLCALIVLGRARPDSWTSCATVTLGTQYAECLHRTDRTDDTGPGIARQATIEDADATLADLPPATDSDAPARFTGRANASSTTSWVYEGPDVRVELTEGKVDEICFSITLATATAGGCATQSQIATGLAYGAFRDGDGAVDYVGIVPDEVTQISVGSTTLPVASNVWHHRTEPGVAVTFDPHVATRPTASPSSCEHSVVVGDNPAGIAEQYGVTLQALNDANTDNPNYSTFVLGSEIHIPC